MMSSQFLGRTNRAFPPVWLSLGLPPGPAGTDWAPALVEEALAAKTVLDISINPGLWGGLMRGTDALLMARGNADIENATDSRHAFDLIQAHLLQTLSAIGREQIDFYFLKIRRVLEEFQIEGALEALASAREEGHIVHLGIDADGPGLAILGVWQFHDAFEVALLPNPKQRPEDFSMLASLAAERRVGIASLGEPHEQSHAVLALCTSPTQVRELHLVGGKA